MQVAAVAPIGPADQQRLLQAQGPDDRLRLLDVLLAEESDYLAARLGMG
jgi:Lon protease-like protein